MDLVAAAEWEDEKIQLDADAIGCFVCALSSMSNFSILNFPHSPRQRERDIPC
jgi:hypothetical protein